MLRRDKGQWLDCSSLDSRFDSGLPLFLNFCQNFRKSERALGAEPLSNVLSFTVTLELAFGMPITTSSHGHARGFLILVWRNRFAEMSPFIQNHQSPC